MNYSVGKKWKPDKISDSISNISYAFWNFTDILKSPEKIRIIGALTFFTRNNSYPFGKNLVKGDRSQNVNVFAELAKNKHHQFRFNATFAIWKSSMQLWMDKKPDQSLLGRVEYIANIWKGLLTGNALYEVGSGRSKKGIFLCWSACRNGSI